MMKELTINKLKDVPLLGAEQVPGLLDAAQVEFHPINVVNWKEYPYCPAVEFRAAHAGNRLFVHYRITEQSVRAVAPHDGGRVWEDSCCEFFVQPADDGLYYNFECNCAGTLLLNCGKPGDRTPAPKAVMEQVLRWSSLGREPFGERSGGPFHWELALVIPVNAFFRHSVESLDGKEMRGNFYKCGDLLPVPHFLSWNPIHLPKPNFHCPEFFGKLKFMK